MKILAIETATESCSVALAFNGQVDQLVEHTANAHSKVVLQMVRQLLADQGIGLAELDAIAVDVGPGSFTGLRIGIGVAQGLAYGSNLKVIPVGSLVTLAAQAEPGPVLAAIDARMGQLYWSLLWKQAGSEIRLDTLTEPAVDDPAQLVATLTSQLENWLESSPAHDEQVNRVTDPLQALGTGIQTYAAQLPDKFDLRELNILSHHHPQAEDVARIALALGVSSTISPLHLSAVYVRNNVAEKSADQQRT